MNRLLAALVLMLLVGLQGSLGAFAAANLAMQSDCGTSMESPVGAAHQSCCPSTGLHTAGCCLDACLAAAVVATSPVFLVSYARPMPAPPVGTANFFSRGDSPLIRPPIL